MDALCSGSIAWQWLCLSPSSLLLSLDPKGWRLVASGGSGLGELVPWAAYMRSPSAVASPGLGRLCGVSTWRPGLAQLGSLRHNLQEPKAVSSDLGLHGLCLLTHTVFLPQGLCWLPAGTGSYSSYLILGLPPCSHDPGTCSPTGPRSTLGWSSSLPPFFKATFPAYKILHEVRVGTFT